MTEFNSDKVKAIAVLLEDPSEDVQHLMEAQLVKFSMPELRELRKKIGELNLELAFHLDDLLQQKTLTSFIVELEQIASSGVFDLEVLVCFISRFIENDLTDEMIVHELDQLAAKCKEYISTKRGLEPEKALIEYLGQLCRFRGNDQNYYAVGNSSIHCLLKTKKGLPITLSVLYVLVGKRVGIPVEGVALPGHFIAEIEKDSETLYLDPYNRGKVMTKDDCISLVRRSGYPFSEDMLDSIDSRAIFFRILNNLKFVFQREGKEESEEAVNAMIRIWTDQVFRQVL